MPVAVASDPQEIEAIQEAENESMGAETAVKLRQEDGYGWVKKDNMNSTWNTDKKYSGAAEDWDV